MPDKDNADQLVEIDPMDRASLSDDDLGTAAGGGALNDIKPPTLDAPLDGTGGG